MRRKALVGAVAVALLLVGTTPPAHAGREYTWTYVQGFWLIGGCLPWGVPTIVPGLQYPGPVCGTTNYQIPVHAGETEVAIRIEDMSGIPMPGEVYFTGKKYFGQEGPQRPSGRFCGSGTVAIPGGKDKLKVVIEGDACGASEPIGTLERRGATATVGKVVATFT